jgi:hypothetical protein
MITTTSFGEMSKISNTDYLEFKQNVFENYPIKKEFYIRDFKIENIKTLYHVPTKSELKLSDNAFSNLLKIFKLSYEQETFFVDKLGTANTTKLLEVLRKAISKNNTSYYFYIDKNNKEITAISVKKAELITKDTFFEYFEKVSSNYDINQMYFNVDGDLSISVRTNNEFVLNEISNDEIYKTGIEFNLSNTNFLVNSYLVRLICANGLTQNIDKSQIKLKENTMKGWQEFNSEFFETKKRNFVNDQIKKRIVIASKTKASLDELLKSVKQLDTVGIDEKLINEYLPLQDTFKTFNAAKIDITKLKVRQKQNYATSVTVKELVDVLTDVGSHNPTGTKNHHGLRETLKFSGNLMFKPILDTQYLVKQLY